MDAAENTAMSHQDDPVIPDFQYYNAKEMLEPFELPPPNITNRALDDRSLIPVDVPPSYLTLVPSKHFNDIKINTSMSCVHIPTNVFDRCMYHHLKFLNFYMENPIFFCSRRSFKSYTMVREIG